ncbi:MAG: hypothetical protein QMD22_11795 [archaeon]|nr:hypothetical protein [archaeon]
MGIGKNEEGQMAIVIMVEKELPIHEEIIPKSLEGIPTKIKEVGVIKALKIGEDK